MPAASTTIDLNMSSIRGFRQEQRAVETSCAHYGLML